MSKKQIIDQLVILAEAFGLPINEARLAIYADTLADIPLPQLKAGIVHLIKTRTFAGNLPTVAEIREAALGGGQSIETRAALAWETAMKAIHDLGPYQSPTFEDPIITRIVIAWGGWIDFGDWPAQETKWRKKEFEKLYAAYAQAPPGQIPDHLVGIAEGNNRDRFPEFTPATVQIGGNGQRRLN